MNVIVTWMYSSPESENILHHQVGSQSGTLKVQNYYWRCLFLLFESSERLNGDSCRHILFVNKMPPSEIDGISTDILIKQYHIEIIKLDNITKSPHDYFGAWNTQFIVLDILDALRTKINNEDAIYILDGDMIFNKPISNEMMNDLNKHKILLYTIDYPLDYPINGVSRNDLIKIAKEIEPSFPYESFQYSGGEFICLKGSEISNVAELARKYYTISLERHAARLPKFNEEAHLLSFIYQIKGCSSHTGNPFVKRIWTDRSTFSNIQGDEDDLVLWHLPAEKKDGFVKVFRSYVRHGDGYYLNKSNFKKKYRIEIGIGEKTFYRLRRFMRSFIKVIYK